MRVRVHRVDELDNIEKYMTGSELVSKVAQSLPTDPGFIPLSKIRTSVTFELDSTRNHAKSDIYISKSEESRLKLQNPGGNVRPFFRSEGEFSGAIRKGLRKGRRREACSRGKRSHQGSEAKYRVVHEFARHERMPVRTSYGCDKNGFD